jgi:hypothetical protein
MHIHCHIALNHFERIVESVRILLYNLLHFVIDNERLLSVDDSYQLTNPTKENPGWSISTRGFKLLLH